MEYCARRSCGKELMSEAFWMSIQTYVYAESFCDRHCAQIENARRRAEGRREGTVAPKVGQYKTISLTEPTVCAWRTCGNLLELTAYTPVQPKSFIFGEMFCNPSCAFNETSCRYSNRSVVRGTNPAIQKKAKRKAYGLSLEDWQSMYDAQGGKCKVCRKPFPGRITIDHDHTCCETVPTCGRCNKGLLCNTCNGGLGCFHDDIDLMQDGITYLRAYEEVKAMRASGYVQLELF